MYELGQSVKDYVYSSGGNRMTDLNQPSRWEEVTLCCGVKPEYQGQTYLYKSCPKCNQGGRAADVATYFTYHPSGYEQSLEERIKTLERKTAGI
jgi:hypothetical protein